MRARDLPIFGIEPDLLDAIRSCNRIVLAAPTGSGKSTQVPQMLLDHGAAGQGRVLVLQPRRLPARMLARRVAAERGGEPGGEVGWQVRFEKRWGPASRIVYLTEGVLVRRMLEDPALEDAAILILDEFHERHLETDLALGLALRAQERRPALRLIVMSATLDAAALEKQLAPCRVVRAEGRAFPVATEFLRRPLAEREGVWDAAAAAFERLAAEEPEGDFLVFMPGAYEIQRTLQAIRAVAGREFLLAPLHGDLPPEEQDAAVAPAGTRKVIVSTNVAETSLTIEGVRIVIDSGLARIARHDPVRGINTLLVERISRASAEQRAGRAGRTAPGRCVRLWTEREHLARPARETPEIHRVDLAEAVLQLKAAGFTDPRTFPWIEPPDERALARAEQLLADLGAVDGKGAITGTGGRMLAFPAHPRFAAMLLAADRLGCVRPAALLAAITQGRPLLTRGGGREVEALRDDLWGGETKSDLFVLMRAWRLAERHGFDPGRCRRAGVHAQAARQAGQVFAQLLRIAEAQGLNTSETPAPEEAIRRAVLAGFADHLAVRLDEGTLRCGVVHGRRGNLDRDSVVRGSRLLVAAEIRETGGGGRDPVVLLGTATEIEESWLEEMFPGSVRSERGQRLDPATRRVVVEERRLFRDLVLAQREVESSGGAGAGQMLAAEVAAGRLVLKSWDDAVEAWIARLNWLAAAMPELELPPIRPEDRLALIGQVCHGASGYKEIKDRDVKPVVRSWLNPAQHAALEAAAPERIPLPGGRAAKVRYPADPAGTPSLAARIQDLYGVEGALRIAGGKVPLRIEILAPNQRPVQVASDLAKFWREDYPRIKQELQRKYPKHKWR